MARRIIMAVAALLIGGPASHADAQDDVNPGLTRDDCIVESRFDYAAGLSDAERTAIREAFDATMFRHYSTHGMPVALSRMRYGAEADHAYAIFESDCARRVRWVEAVNADLMADHPDDVTIAVTRTEVPFAEVFPDQ
jgi:hypothetical protein